MGKAKTGNKANRSRAVRAPKKELSEIQKLKTENAALKRQLTRLRKQIARHDMERYENIREAMEIQKKEDQVHSEMEKQKKLIEKWQCFECGTDYLRLLVIERPDGHFYFRRCPTCDNRTKMKPLKKKVEGPAA